MEYARAPARFEAELHARFEQRLQHLGALGPRAPEFEPGLACHAVAKHAGRLAGDRDLAHVEELDLRRGLAGDLLDDLERVRTLQLVAVQRGVALTCEGVVVTDELDIPIAGLDVVLDPVRKRRGHQVVVVLAELEENAVADHVAAVVHRDQLLRATGLVRGRRVRADPGEEVRGVRAGDEQIRHVVGLIQQRDRVPPGGLFAPPVGEFGLHREGERARLRVADNLHRASGLVDGCLKTLTGHGLLFREGRLRP